jgi:hypothetical protein
MCGVLLWAAACAFVAVNQEENPHHENRIIDYVLLAGKIFFSFERNDPCGFCRKIYYYYKI